MMRFVLRSLAVLSLLFWAVLAAAQEQPRDENDPLYPFWDEVAENAEQAIDAEGDTSTAALEELRARLVAFRSEFDKDREANASRIANLESQIQALGPVPEDGVEAAEITATRAQLQSLLDGFQAPVRVADSAFQRSDGLIGEIDAIIRERQARRLLSLGPSPLDPRNLPAALKDYSRILQDLRATAIDMSSQRRQEQLQNQLPLIVFLILLSLAIIFKGRSWAGTAVDRMRSLGGRGSGVWTFLASLLRIVVPLTGVFLLTYAFRLTGVLSDKFETLLRFLPYWAAGLFGFRWLADRLFSRDDDEALLDMPKEKRRAARFYLTLLAVLLIMRGVVEVVVDLESAVPEARALLAFPIVVLTAFVLFLLGYSLRRYQLDASADEDDEPVAKAGKPRAARIIGTFMVCVSLVSPVMSAIGYAQAGNALLYPTTLSVVIIGLVAVLQRFSADVYGLVSGQGRDAQDSLVAILAGFVLFLISLPLLALVWGARVADLTEIWTQFLDGFDIGGTRISPSNFLIFAIVFVLGYTITRVLQSTLRTSVLPKTRLDIGGQNALISGLGYVGLFLAAIVAITVAGLDLSGFALVAGALTVGIGFGLQNIVSNFVSGIILLVERPISEGDWIAVGDQMGYVKDISVRATRIETFDRTDVIVPNLDLVSGTVTNYTRGNTIGRLIVTVGVAYGTDTKKVDAILREIADAQPLVMGNPAPSVIFSNFGADALEFEIRMILRDVNWMLSIKNDINHEIAKRFAEEGIEIPFAQRDLWLRNPEALGGSAARPPRHDDTSGSE